MPSTFNQAGNEYSTLFNSNSPSLLWIDPTTSINSGSLPPFPMIKDLSILADALRHKQLVPDYASPNPAQPLKLYQELRSNKRLELLGDSILGSMIPHIAGLLISNNTISWIAWRYGGFSPSILSHLNDKKYIFTRQVATADLFEAYIVGLF